MADDFIIRVMKKDEINLAIQWAAEEGWNPGLKDAESYYLADPNGFLVGLLNNKPIAVISAIKYDENFGFLGFYIVKPEFRGKGYGLKIWNAAMKYLKDVNVGLDGVVEQQENYKKSGFKFLYSNIRYEGIYDWNSKPDSGVIDLKNESFELVKNYEKDFFPASRNKFLESWINNSEAVAVGIKDDKKLLGYGVIRKCLTGYKIGPLFADNAKLSEQIFSSLISNLKKGDQFYLDIPETNEAAVKLVDKYKMEKVFETARMYTGKDPDLPIEKIFGVTSFEIG